jgi:hypothetical protein
VGLVKWWRNASATAAKREADIDAKAPEWEGQAAAKASGWEPAASAKAAERNARVKKATLHRARRAFASVEAAALAGVGAAVLLSLSAYLIGRQPGVGSSSANLTWYADSGNRVTVFLGLNSAPLGVIAFLWFMAVIRRRLGEREDQLFATVFFGSGIAFGLLTITAAVCAAAPTLVVHFGGETSLDSSTVALAHGLWFGFWGVSASRLVGVFMATTSTIGMRFDALPPWLSRLGLVLGAVLSVTGAFAGPLDFLFPSWLALVSLVLLFSQRKRTRPPADPPR